MNPAATKLLLSQLSKAGAIISPTTTGPWVTIADRYALDNVTTAVAALKEKHGKPVNAAEARRHLEAVYPDVAPAEDEPPATSMEPPAEAVTSAPASAPLSLLDQVFTQGTPQRIATALGLHVSAINYWRKAGHIPLARVPQVERILAGQEPGPKASPEVVPAASSAKPPKSAKRPAPAREPRTRAASLRPESAPGHDDLHDAFALLKASAALRSIQEPTWRQVAVMGAHLALAAAKLPQREPGAA